MGIKKCIISVTPSLVINVTQYCNLQCSYCPPYGENLCEGNANYDLAAVLEVVQCAKQAGFRMLRLTGGEPLLEPVRTQSILSIAKNSFQRLVLNTNGVELSSALEWLLCYRANITLKVSLDTIFPDEYAYITKYRVLDKVLDGIHCAEEMGFSVEINTVLTTQNVESLLATIAFAVQHGFHIKLLTESSFYGNIKPVDSNVLNELIAHLDRLYILEEPETLIGNRGISMLTYRAGNSKIQIVDHTTHLSLTPNRTYFVDCSKNCNQFPCDFGAISLSVSTDGVLTPCRGRKDLGQIIFGKAPLEIRKSFHMILEQYNYCININVNNL